MPVIDLTQLRRIHVVGVGGAGMSAIAEVLAAMGHHVSGSDAAEFPVLARVRDAGVDVHVGFDPANLHGADVVAVSTAWLDGNVEVDEARRRGIPVLRRAEALGAICALRRTIAVAGTHGKTTTSALLATILLGAGRKPSFIVGGQLRGVGTGARWDDGEWLVVEADESDGTFLELPAEVAIVTSVEPDHLEHWGGFEPLEQAFGAFVGGAAASVVCADDPGAAGLGSRPGVTTYGFAEAADERILSYEGGRAQARFSLAEGEVTLPLPGRHNTLNAVAAITAAARAGVAFADAAAALAGFQGVARRFDRRGEAGGVSYVDEYAHLPTEVRASLATAADGAWRRVVCVFQPHRYSRTAALWQDFAHAFDDADVLVVTDVYPAGEPPRPGVTGKLIVDAVLDVQPHRRVAWAPTRAALTTFLRRELRPGDLCLTLGAGDLTTLPTELLC
jgi:UDP-N-acetylmuramate--alanine ligase